MERGGYVNNTKVKVEKLLKDGSILEEFGPWKFSFNFFCIFSFNHQSIIFDVLFLLLLLFMHTIPCILAKLCYFVQLLFAKIGEDKDLSVMAHVELKKLFPNKNVSNQSSEDQVPLATCYMQA